MKRIRAGRPTRCLLHGRSGFGPSCVREPLPATAIRMKSNTSNYRDPSENGNPRFPPLDPNAMKNARYASPLPSRALESAKLAALHARLGLPQRLPLQTMARSLIDASADANPHFNNANLVYLGHSLINYQVTEWLICRYPRLPMSVMYAALKTFAGDSPLYHVSRSWGIEAAAAPGGEVDPGLLQFDVHKAGVAPTRFGYRRADAEHHADKKFKFRRGISSRVVMDDDFGDSVEDLEKEFGIHERVETSKMAYGIELTRRRALAAYANSVRAVVGSIYAHCGRAPAHDFIRAHILSRTADLSRLFEFKHPTIELAMLCAREEFEDPVARLLSETGRLSSTPVFVIGIFSGPDKLGEGSGPTLPFARQKAAINALKAWYLYSPPGGDAMRLPSEMLKEGAKTWEPAYIDIGEIVGR